MKLNRLIGILSILIQKDKATAAELAEKFEVSRRTIYRDIEDISKSGIPIAAEKGKGGGIYIMDGFKIDRTLLSSSDMKAILAGLQSLDSVSGTKRYRQLMDKLSINNSETLNAGNHIIIDLSSWDKAIISDKIELIKLPLKIRKKFHFHILLRTETVCALSNRIILFFNGQAGMFGVTALQNRIIDCSSLQE